MFNFLGELDEKMSYPRSGDYGEKGSVSNCTGGKDDKNDGRNADSFGIVEIKNKRDQQCGYEDEN